MLWIKITKLRRKMVFLIDFSNIEIYNKFIGLTLILANDNFIINIIYT